MTDVVIAGIGQTTVGEHWNIALRELALEAIEKAREDAGGLRPQALFVGNMLAPTLSRQSHLGTLIADFAGLAGIEATVVEAAGATGGLALRYGALAVSAGFVDVALVVGVEKMTDQIGEAQDAALSTTIDSDYEAEQGLTLTAQAALLKRRYMHEFDLQQSLFAGFPITAHHNAMTNPNAMFRRAISEEIYTKAGMVSEPVNIFDVAPNADGAAALLLCRSELIPDDYAHPKVHIAGSSVVTDTLALHDRPDPLIFAAVRESVRQVFEQVSIKNDEIDFFEYFDGFTIYAVLALEAAGYADFGRGWKLAQDGIIKREGKLPVATFGGLKARGNPGGATGVYQAVEATLQLRGQAGENQIRNAKRALIQCLGGPASTVATHILEVK